MKSSLSLSPLKKGVNLFYLVIFLPLLLIAYYYYFSGSAMFGISIPYYRERSFLGVLIPFYGFLILFLKKDQFSPIKDPTKLQRFSGLAAIIASFFMFYTVASLSSYALYAAATLFYAVYVLGSLLLFFGITALRESFSAVFLIVAGGYSYYVGEWLELYMEPAVPQFVQLFLLILRLLNIPATASLNPNSILLSTPRGITQVNFAAACIGIYSFLAFSILIVVIMIDQPTNIRTKALWSIGGAVGTFFINIVRVGLIAWVIYYNGYNGWQVIHSWIGYTLFFLWLGLFFVIFFKRGVIWSKLEALWSKG